MTRHLLSLPAALTLAALLASGCTLIISEKLDEKPEDPTDSGTGMTDGGPEEDAFVPDTDAGPTVSVCEGATDGTLCTVDGVSGMFVCVDEMCSVSACGDGVVDSRLSEQCDDGNELSGDGCEPFTCTFSCSAADECDDLRTCNGTETCNESTHVCEPGDAADDGTDCARDDGSEGVCRAGSCVGAGCGNGAPDDGEECDDGNLEDGDGCDSDCTYTCETDEECNDGDVCDGEEVCDLGTHTCSEGEPMECVDEDMCTVDGCDPIAGCTFDSSTNDADGDGHFAESCGGDDCDDTDRTIYTGAEELCDSKDNDCDGSTDETAPFWYVDCDEDTFSGGTSGSVQACLKPRDPPSTCGSFGGWTSTRPNTGAVDCNDNNRSARPGQTGWYTERDGTVGYDYNCDGSETRQYLTRPFFIAFCKFDSSGACGGTIYWDEDRVPGCGTTATQSWCTVERGSCVRRSRTATVACH